MILQKKEEFSSTKKMTCAGDEIGWVFIQCVMASKINFTGFCTHMTNLYRTTHSNPQPFMAVKTFIGCFFGWLSAFKIDLRKEVDPFCRCVYNPRVLTCDGTHIGISLRHLKLEKPVIKSDKDNIIPWVHHKPERHMFHKEEVKNFVRYMCGILLNHINPEKLLDPNVERALTAQTLKKILRDKPLKDFMEPVLLGIGRKDYLKICAEFLHTLPGDEFIGTVIPP